MKIVEMVPDLTFGGAERFVTDLCNALIKEGNQVTLITLFDTKGMDTFEPLLSDNVKFLCLNKKIGFSPIIPFKILFTIFKEKPSVVHTHLNCFIYTILAWLFLPWVKFVHTIHNDAYAEAGSTIELKMKKIAFGRFVTPVTISHESQKSFWELYKKDSFLIYNGRPIDNPDYQREKAIESEIASIKSSHNTKIIVNIARFAAQKNQLSLAKAVNIINKDKPQIDLLFVGSYQHAQDSIEIFNAISKIITPHIHILGAKSNASSFFKYADAFCLSSIYEGMPITIIESFANGCPVLSTPVGGVVNMINDGINGFLTKDTEVESIVATLEKFCSLTEKERLSMKKNAKDSYEQFSMNRCVQAYLSCFSKI